MSNVEIVSQMQSLSDLLLNSYDVFEIPDFQRSDVWTEKEIKQMLLDFSEDTDNFSKESADLEGYLLGNIVLITKDNGRKKNSNRWSTKTNIYFIDIQSIRNDML